MRILILTQWYQPEPPKLLWDLAQSLQAMGHHVEVLTGFPNYPSGTLYPGYRLSLWQKEVLDGIPVTRVLLYPDHGRSAFRRTLNFVSFAASVILLGPWLASRPDVIHVIFPPAIVGGPAWFLSRLWRVPFTLEIHDMWPETLRATGMVRNEFALGLVGGFAKWVYQKTASIRVITPGFRDNLVTKGVPHDKIHVISEWVDNDFFHPMEPDREAAVRLGLDGRFNVMYAGAIGLAQGLDTVLEAAVLLRDLTEVQFVLVGDGVQRATLEAAVRDRKLDNVRFLGYYPMDAMPSLYALADVLLIHLRDDPLFRITIPHKTFTYMASGKPVLAAVAGNAATVVESAGAGLTCPPDDPQAMADTVRKLYSLSPLERGVMSGNGRRAACETYDRHSILTQMDEFLSEAVKTLGVNHIRHSTGQLADELLYPKHLVLRREHTRPTSTDFALPEGFTIVSWQPTLLHAVPSSIVSRWKFGLLATMFFMLGRGGSYRVYTVFAPDGSVAHYSVVHPKYFRFPFMAEGDLQIGGLWTEPRYRGLGLATYAVQAILRAETSPNRVYWYVVADDNPPSIRVAEKNGFTMYGFAARVRRFGGLLARFEILDVSS